MYITHVNTENKLDRLPRRNRKRTYARKLARHSFGLIYARNEAGPSSQPQSPAEIIEHDRQARRRLDMPDRLVAARYEWAASNDSLAAGLIGSGG